ncbi:hydrolase [Wenjunlia vitaminophila]|uniref:Hydrolase n=1 Tax=Wenjunlia vitaminophila TaxID=76728 RepID=A0A0T6LS19_WENVI|nr:alpha/beta hydrolase [Wenjunlia vitaminophila]KRV48915.1 hydrolase [Wenjunlia vitaminophila]
MTSLQQSIRVSAPNAVLDADMVVPRNAPGAVLFAHGSGSSRMSPRNRYVASALNNLGIATVLADLLTADEEQVDTTTGALRFDIDLLAERVAILTDWLVDNEPAASRGIALFGASTGAAAALVAAARRPETVRTVVSRGGRPDLAGDSLPLVHQPTLLIVGGDDTIVIDLNREAMERLAAEEQRLEIVPDASHLFEEPGALEEVARLSGDWILQHLGDGP